MDTALNFPPSLVAPAPALLRRLAEAQDKVVRAQATYRGLREAHPETSAIFDRTPEAASIRAAASAVWAAQSDLRDIEQLLA